MNTTNESNSNFYEENQTLIDDLTGLLNELKEIQNQLSKRINAFEDSSNETVKHFIQADIDILENKQTICNLKVQRVQNKLNQKHSTQKVAPPNPYFQTKPKPPQESDPVASVKVNFRDLFSKNLKIA
jgi:hypothetical protein